MGSHVGRRHGEMKPPAGGGESLRVESGDADEGWSSVERALAWVHQVVGGLAEDLQGDVGEPVCSSSHQLTGVVDVDQLEDATRTVDDGARCCIADACDML